MLRIDGLPEDQNYKLTIYSISGVAMLYQDYTNNTNVYLSDFIPGIYIAEISGNGEALHRKFLLK